MSVDVASGHDSQSHDSASEDEFEDALDDVEPNSSSSVNESQIDVATGTLVLESAVDLMNSNQYIEAIKLLKPQAHVSMYHSMAYGTVLFLKAGFSMEKEVIEKATDVLNKTVALCSRCRKDKGVIESMSSWIFGQRMDSYSVAELQAEIYYAECNMLLSFLTFLQDESLVSFMKGGLRIRSCYSLYKQLYQWLKTCEEEGLEVEPNFAAGVQMGIGCFNLYLSMLPNRVLRLLEFVGFSCNRSLGLSELERGAASGTFRSSLCTSFLLFYYTVAQVIMGSGEGDVGCAEVLLRPQLEKYPDSVLFLFFKGRLELMSGFIEKATGSFERSISVQQEWAQVHHLCWWELYWCHCLMGQWQKAVEYANKLYSHSKWSKASFLYMKTACLLMQRDTEAPPTSPDEVVNGVKKTEMEEMMRQIPPHKQRIAGRSIPLEKFVIAKSERYLDGGRLPLCGMELLYTHNAYGLLSKNEALLRNLLKNVWTELMIIEETRGSNSYYADDWVVATLLQGVCFRGLLRHDEAEMCFLSIQERAEDVKYDRYAVAAADTELGLLYIDMGRLEEAEQLLEATKTKYKGYHLETRIHFRIHAGKIKIAELKSSG